MPGSWKNMRRVRGWVDWINKEGEREGWDWYRVGVNLCQHCLHVVLEKQGVGGRLDVLSVDDLLHS